jgi:hypothetical protein
VPAWGSRLPAAGQICLILYLLLWGPRVGAKISASGPVAGPRPSRVSVQYAEVGFQRYN